MDGSLKSGVTDIHNFQLPSQKHLPCQSPRSHERKMSHQMLHQRWWVIRSRTRAPKPEQKNINDVTGACKWLMIQPPNVCGHTFGGVNWHSATGINSIQLHDSFVMVPSERKKESHKIENQSSQTRAEKHKWCNWGMQMIDDPASNCVWPHFRWCQLAECHRDNFNSIAWLFHDGSIRKNQFTFTFTLHLNQNGQTTAVLPKWTNNPTQFDCSSSFIVSCSF